MPLFEDLGIPQERLNACAVYYVWGDPLYLRYAYVSLLGQMACTDLFRVDVKVFADSQLLAEARRILGKLPGVAVLEHPNLLGSHAVTTRPELAGYDKIFLVDADVFFHGPRFPLYARLCVRREAILMEPDGNPAGMMFARRRLLSEAFIGKPHAEYVAAFSSCAGLPPEALLASLEGVIWPYGCFIVLDRRFLQRPDWADYAARCAADLGTWCCESILLIYCLMRGIPIGDLNSTAGFRLAVADAEEALRNPGERLLALHPLQDRIRLLGPLARRLLLEPDLNTES